VAAALLVVQLTGRVTLLHTSLDIMLSNCNWGNQAQLKQSCSFYSDTGDKNTEQQMKPGRTENYSWQSVQ